MPTTSASNVIYVENPHTNKVEKYVTISLRGEPGVPSSINTYKQSLTATESQQVQSMQRSRSFIQDFFDTHNDVPEEIATSAYDMVENSANQFQISQNYLANQSIQQAIGDYTSVLIAIAGKYIGVNLVVTVTFSDNSTSDFAIVGLDGSGSIALAVLNARDANGNNISLVKAGFTGNMNFNAGDEAFREFQETVARLNIPVLIDPKQSGSGGSSSSSTPMECRFVDGRYHCTKIAH